MREGYWYTGKGSLLPKPVPNEKPWKGKKLFLKWLAKRESEAYKEHFKGSSKCRVCGKKNGSASFQLLGWQWPSGFAHYVREHNVRPSLAFQEFILGSKDNKYWGALA
jgi:hypothetical protein